MIDPVIKAELQIRDILKKLQDDHGITITDIAISETDITVMGDKNKKHLLSVVLHHEPMIKKVW